MLPIIDLAGLQLRTWGLLNSFALLAVLAAAYHEGRYRRVDAGLLLRMWPWVLAAGVLGAHLYYLLAAGQEGLSLRTLSRPLEGTAIQGGMIGGALAVLVYFRVHRASPWPYLDVLAPGGALAHAFMRIGCFLAGCCYGKPTSLPWGVVFRHPNSDAPVGVPLHPAQLYETVLDFGLAWLLHLSLRDGKGRDGRVFWQYIGGYGLIRFSVQFFRDDDAGHLVWGLAHSQFMALGMLAAAAVFLLRPEPPQIKNQ